MSERAMAPIRMRRPAWIDEFRAFIMRGNVVDLAVGIIIGVAFTAVVNSLVKDIFTPAIGLIVGGIDFSNIFVALKGPATATLADAQKAGAASRTGEADRTNRGLANRRVLKQRARRSARSAFGLKISPRCA